MAVPDGMTKLVVSGTLAGGAENWAFSLWISGTTQYPDTGSFDVTALDSMPTWVTFRTALLGFMATGDAITQYDAYWYQGGQAVGHTQQTVAWAGTGSSNIMPAQIALVLSLRTALSTRQGRGRIYLPIGSAGLSAGTRLPASAANYNTICDDLAAVMTAWNAGGLGWHAAVCSQTGSAAHPITSVSVDTVLDTQRRRRTHLKSAIHSHTV